jgi:hypothetical protein
VATYGELIDRVAANVGDPDAGLDATRRARILQDMVDLLQIDIPNRIGGPFAEGFVSLTIGGAGGSADGRYALPTRLRTPRNLIRIGTNVLLFNHAESGRREIERDPLVFWATWDETTVPLGTPQQALIYGTDIWFRPAPNPALAALTAELWGTVYPNFSTITEGTAVSRLDFETLLVAYGTTLESARTGKEAILQVWSGLLEARMSGLRAAAEGYPDRAVPLAREF